MHRLNLPTSLFAMNLSGFARLRPSQGFVRALTALVAAALAAATCWLGWHPADAIAQTTAAEKAASAPAATDATHPERMVWDKAPLQIALGVGPAHERAITFPAQMHIGVPQEVAALLRVQTVGRTSYVTALAPFPRTRVVAEDRASGTAMLLDLTASAEQRPRQPVEVVVPTAAEPHAARDDGDAQQPPPVDMVTLTRFAAQQMYAPRRLATAHPAIRRVPLAPRTVDDLYAGGGVRASPAAQWRGDRLYVTAVVLQNLRGDAVELDPQDVRGRWRAITFQHGRLFRHGTEADTTVVYLVCERPFEACR